MIIHYMRSAMNCPQTYGQRSNKDKKHSKFTVSPKDHILFSQHKIKTTRTLTNFHGNLEVLALGIQSNNKTALLKNRNNSCQQNYLLQTLQSKHRQKMRKGNMIKLTLVDFNRTPKVIRTRRGSQRILTYYCQKRIRCIKGYRILPIILGNFI